MRKIIKFLGGIPASIRTAAKKALRITTYLLNMLESKQAIMVTALIPGDLDDTLREAIIALLKSVQPSLETASDTKVKKAIAARVGAEIVALQDGNKEKMGQYSIWFEKVYQEQA